MQKFTVLTGVAAPLDILNVEVGCRQLEPPLGRLQQDVREDRNGVAPLHHALHMRERLEEG